MVSEILTYAAAAIVGAWGVAHLVPTRAVVAGFGDLTPTNRQVLTMEWVAEGLTLIFVGALAATVGAVGSPDAPLAVAVKALAAGMLVAMALLTALTGARSGVVFFKACPAVKGMAALLLVLSIAA
jgi:hypothetical protein